MTVELLRQGFLDGVSRAKAPGAVVCVGIGDERILLEATGWRALTPEREAATVDTLYDLASLTKVVAATTAVMLLRDAGELSLDQPVSRFIPMAAFEKLTLRHLLTHTTGLPAWRPWHTEASGLLDYVGRIAEQAGAAAPDTRRDYSDMGFILLARVVEQVARDAFDVFCKDKIFAPLGMKDTCFTPSEALRRRCAPTERCAWRNRLLRGEVHDENASAIGGVSGHAGLFGTAPDLELFCRALLQGRLLSEATLDEMLRVGQVSRYPWQGIGWWVDPWAVGANGYLLSRQGFGHTGWTGTAIWMDRASGLYTILLSNTCHPSRNTRNNGELRRRFYTGVANAYYPRATNAHTGLDKLLRNNFEEVRGKRTALLTNSAAVDQTGRSILDVFALDPSVRPRLLYSPEHGFFGQAEAGERVSSEQRDVPIISLYGDRKRPSADELRDIDLFVVDLPDIGARYYTYMATMRDCMAACAQHGTPMLVLDRPNPIGGVTLEGTPAQVHGSSVCCAPIPIRHGMTLGELARHFQRLDGLERRLVLTVLTAENWWREIQHEDSALPWMPPSPNIPTAETALMYIGTCLFEGLNMNEGRGTETPFLVCGAPWLDAERIIERLTPEDLTGCSVKPVLYIPKSIPGKASNPTHRDKLCRGIRFTVTDRYAVRPLRVALAVISAVHRLHGDALEWKPFFDTLAGGPRLREQLQAGRSAGEIVGEAEAELARFASAMPVLYPTLAERARR